MPDIGDILEYRKERDDSEDLYTVSVTKDAPLLGMFHMKNHMLCGTL